MSSSEPETQLSRPAGVVLVCLLTGLLLIMRLFVAGSIELFQDEALYHWMGVKSPLGFSPHPPGVPFLVVFGTSLFGRTEWALRLFPLLLTSCTVPLFFLLARRTWPSVAGWATVAFAAVPIYLGFGGIATPDGPQLFMWLLLLLVTWRALHSHELLAWLLAGVVAGLGLFIKFMIILYWPSLFVCLLLSPQARRHLRHAGPYIAAVAAMLLFLPIAI